jgi:hypothetical protein
VANFRLGRFTEARDAFLQAADAPDAAADEQREYTAKAQVAAARAGLLTSLAQ